MVAYCSGHCVGTVDTFFSPELPQELEISNKIFLERKIKMLAYFLGRRVCTIEASLSPVRSPEIETSKKKISTEKRKCSHTVQGTALVELTSFFHLCDLQKSRYRRKMFWTEKRKKARILFTALR